MKRFTAIALALGVFTLATAAIAMPGTARAEEPDVPAAQGKAKGLVKGLGERLQRRQHEQPAAVAIALGAIEGSEEAYLNFRAADGAERDGGNLRFWTEDDGYYNGNVRGVTINGQNVHAEGGGPLWKPDGTHTLVRFSIDLNGGSNHVSITVTGRDLDYTIEGTVEGFVFIGQPPQKLQPPQN
jgi:hypothetical protein